MIGCILKKLRQVGCRIEVNLCYIEECNLQFKPVHQLVLWVKSTGTKGIENCLSRALAELVEGLPIMQKAFGSVLCETRCGFPIYNLSTGHPCLHSEFEFKLARNTWDPPSKWWGLGAIENAIKWSLVVSLFQNYESKNENIIWVFLLKKLY